MSDDRIAEIEIKIAFQEDLIQTLNNIVASQQQQISRLEETCKYLNERINNKSEEEHINQGAEIPPHY